MTDDRTIDPAARLFSPRTEGAPPASTINRDVLWWVVGGAAALAIFHLIGLNEARSEELPPSERFPDLNGPYEAEVRRDVMVGGAIRLVCQPDGQTAQVEVNYAGFATVTLLLEAEDCRATPPDAAR